MKEKFWKTNEFKELQKEWNHKLEESGFIDCEELIDEQPYLKQWTKVRFCKMARIAREGKTKYYELMLSGFNEEKFEDDIERLVMERVVNAVLIKDISEELRYMGERCHRETIRHIVQKYEVKWGIKKKK